MIDNETTSEQSTVRARRIVKNIFRHENAILSIVLVVLVVAFANMTEGLSLSMSNIRNVLLQSSMRGIVSIGQLFVILTAGIDLSVGALAGLCAVLGASLLTEGPRSIVGSPVSLATAIAVMLSVGIGIGVFNGFSVSRIRMPALIVTLAVWQMANGGVFQLTQGVEISGLPNSMAFFGQESILGVPVPTIIFVVTAAAAYFVLHHTTFGHSVYAVGGNPVTAWLSGINVRNIVFMVYVISGFLAALTGLVLVSRNMSGGMWTATGLEIDCIAAVVVGGVSLGGGKGTLVGTILGVMIIGVMNNGMNLIGVAVTLQRVLRGVVIFSAVAVDYLRRR